jgi:parvulin-like peptidyl-prolyl isomerase
MYMKRVLNLLFLCVIITGLCFAQSDLQPAAIIRLTKSEPITVKQFRNEVERVEKVTIRSRLSQRLGRQPRDEEFAAAVKEQLGKVLSVAERRQVLDEMIDERMVLQEAVGNAGVIVNDAEVNRQLQQLGASVGLQITDERFAEAVVKQYALELPAFREQVRNQLIIQKYIADKYIVQAAEKARITTGNAEIDKELQQLRNELASSLGHPPTNDEFTQIIRQRMGMDINTLREQLKKQLTMQKYLLSLVGGPPSENEITDYYNINKVSYQQPDTISFNWIQVLPGNSAAERTSARQKADSLAKEIGSSASKFNEKYIQGQTPNAGYNTGTKRYIPLNSPDPRIAQQIQREYGMDFINAALKLKKDDISGLLETPQGFLIIKIAEKEDAKSLGLTDVIQLGTAVTVRDLIYNNLLQVRITEATQKVTKNITSELRARGTVQLVETNLTW